MWILGQLFQIFLVLAAISLLWDIVRIPFVWLEERRIDRVVVLPSVETDLAQRQKEARDQVRARAYRAAEARKELTAAARAS